MRRLTSIFKRSDKSDDGSSHVSDIPPSSTATKKPPRFFRSLSQRSAAKDSVGKSSVLPVPPVPHAYSSSSSSTDSPSPPTPDEESVPFRAASGRPPIPWLAGKHSIPLTDNSYGWDAHSSFQNIRPHHHSMGTRTDESEDDGSSATSSSRSEATSSSIPRSVAPLAYAHSLTTNSLTPTLSVPPLLHLPGTPLFPRSSNSISSLSHQETIESTLHRTHLLRRLERSELSQSEKRSIASFASRRVAPAKCAPAFRLDDDAVKDSKRISRTSYGLKSWVSRPCFEDRVAVYTPAPLGSSHVLNVSRVVGSVFGVAALELSPGLEALAGLAIEEELEQPWTPSAVSGPSSTSPALLPVRNQQYKHSPSPLRLETSSSSPQKLSAGAASPTAITPGVSVANQRPKNSVRFEVEDNEDKEDQIPLGQIMRIKRGRKEKARFLESQREQRLHEEERIRHEMERRQWEKEKQTWEAEKLAIEEEKKKRQYAQEVVAARKRRESQMYKHGSSPDLIDQEPFTREPSTTTYLRPQYDARKQSSEPNSYHSREDMPGSSRGTNRTRVDSRPPSLHSRPPSLHSAYILPSVEDMRREGRGNANMRGSLFSDPHNDFLMQQQFTPSAWTVVPPVPPLPYMSYYNPTMDNMPLLPPAPPFMQQRRRSFNSSPSLDPLYTNPSPERLPAPEPPKRQNAHQQLFTGEIKRSKSVSMANRTPSPPTTISASTGRGFQSRSPPPPSPSIRSPLVVSPNARPALPRTNRRQTAIT